MLRHSSRSGGRRNRGKPYHAGCRARPTQIHERSFAGQRLFAGVYPELPAATILWSDELNPPGQYRRAGRRGRHRRLALNQVEDLSLSNQPDGEWLPNGESITGRLLAATSTPLAMTCRTSGW